MFDVHCMRARLQELIAVLSQFMCCPIYPSVE
jgi:hypothetical protein